MECEKDLANSPLATAGNPMQSQFGASWQRKAPSGMDQIELMSQGSFRGGRRSLVDGLAPFSDLDCVKLCAFGPSMNPLGIAAAHQIPSLT
jgi:hypothetical protein